MAQKEVAPPAPAELQPAPAKPPGPSRRSIVMRVGLLLGIMVVVFVLILPRIVDFGAVAAALSTLTATQLAALAATTGLPTSRTPRPAASWSRG